MINDELRRLRMEAGMTFYALAKKSGVQAKHLQLIEEGKTSPKVDTLVTILDALGYDLRFEKRE